MTADNWGFVLAAYVLAAAVFGGYWRRLARRERELRAIRAAREERAGGSHAARRPGDPRPEPVSRLPRP